MDIQAYLNRIGYSGSRAPTVDTLCRLQRSHLLSVPFENLDIHLGRPIQLTEEALFDKIVTRRRGGFCYEQNNLFAHLLEALGYKVTLLSAMSSRDNGGYDVEFDHLVLQVVCQDEPGVPWLADVGWGGGALEPIKIHELAVQRQGGKVFKVTPEAGYFILLEWVEEANQEPRWLKHYRFNLTPRRIEDFFEMCLYHQTSPDSIFTRKRLCTLFSPDGRVTLSDLSLIITRNGRREERVLGGEEEFRRELSLWFGIENL